MERSSGGDRGRAALKRAPRGDRRRRREHDETARSPASLAAADRDVRSCYTRSTADTAPRFAPASRPRDALGAADRRRPPVRPGGPRGFLPLDVVVGPDRRLPDGAQRPVWQAGLTPAGGTGSMRRCSSCRCKMSTARSSSSGATCSSEIELVSSGAMISTELIAKSLRRRHLTELGVHHRPRAGRGAERRRTRGSSCARSGSCFELRQPCGRPPQAESGCRGARARRPRPPDGDVLPRRRSRRSPSPAITCWPAALRLCSLGGRPGQPVLRRGRAEHVAAPGTTSSSRRSSPAGRLAVDKPPVDLWLQVASVKLLGFNSLALKLPEALAGTPSVPLLYDLVRRVFGRGAGLASALALAVLPVTVLTRAATRWTR